MSSVVSKPGQCTSKDSLAQALDSDVSQIRLTIPLSLKIVSDFGTKFKGKVVFLSPSVCKRSSKEAVELLEELGCSIIVSKEKPGRKCSLSQNHVKLVFKLKENGLSIRKIAALLNVSRSCILRILSHRQRAT